MTNLDEKIIQWVESTEDSIKYFKAPDVSKEIWRRHQLKKYRNYLAIAASACIVMITLWVQQSSMSLKSNSSAVQDLLAQNAVLEQQLLGTAKIALSDRQAAIMSDWYHQLAMIDQNIEIQRSDTFDETFWSSRKKLLSKMVDFHTQPFDFYEI
ncbi:MAG: hypothetical protein OQK09_11410 [Colwellia sp.]|nr:hypothetical protein [Colwellia sp.]MCW9082110.1 hypothetical protein [Colwellia sp.]